MDVHATPAARPPGPLPTAPPAAPEPPGAPVHPAAGPARRPEPGEPPVSGTHSSLTMLKPSLHPADVGARFSIDDTTNRVTVTMYDRRTGEVLREIPPPQVREMLAAGAGRGTVVDVAR